MSLANEKLVIGTSGRHVHIYDLRNMSAPQQVPLSSVFMTCREEKVP
jgi:hypothetical protein